MYRIPTALLIATGSFALAGCQSLLGDRMFTARAPAAELAEADLSHYFDERLESGREHLLRNRPSQAVIAFRQASYSPTHSADAYNGMAVAYSRMGRQDVARRYFEMAVAAAPDDERFTRNLARLETQEGARTLERMLAQAATSPEPVAPSPVASTPAMAQRAIGNAPLVRVSEKEVRLIAPPEPVAHSLPPQVSPRVTTLRPSYPARVALSASAPAKGSAYPVRIALPNPRRVKHVAYPVRVELPTTE